MLFVLAGSVQNSSLEARPALGAGQTGQTPPSRVIAILPFEDISGQPGDDWLGVGIAETIGADLQPVATVSLFEVGDSLTPEVAQELGISWIVSGAYQRVGDQLRITAQVLDVEAGVTQGVARVDGLRSNVFALQDEIVSQLLASFDEAPAPSGTGLASGPAAQGEPSRTTPDEPSANRATEDETNRPAGLTAPAFSQPPPPPLTRSMSAGLDIAVGVGASIPVAPRGFEVLFDPGVSFSVDASRQIRGLIGWRAEFGLDRATLAGADLNIDFLHYGGGITVAPFDGSSRGVPYGFFTVGAFTTDARGADAPVIESETDFGMSVGGGYKWMVGDQWGVGGSLRVNGVFGGSGDVGGDDDAPVWYLTPRALVFFRF